MLSKRQKEQKSIILDKIYTKGPISRIDISKELGITPATVSEITQHLILEQAIYEQGEETNGRAGRKKVLLKVAKEHSYYIGVELFETFLTFCLSDNLGNIILKDLNKRPSDKLVDEEFFLKALSQFIKQCEDYTISSIGIALPGHYNEEQNKIMTNNPIWENFQLKLILDNIDLPVFFENNVVGMALAERLFGNDHNDENFLFLHFRRGMYSSYMYESEIYARDKYLIGEIGHTVVNPNGELCECGKHGCLQTYASQTWIIKKSKIIFDNIQTSYLKELVLDKDDIDINTILAAYELGDRGIISILNNAMKYLAIAINNLLMTMDADTIYLHGELFDNESLKNLLILNLDSDLSLFKNEDKTKRIFKPYSKFNGALGAVALCISETITKKPPL